MLPIVPIHPVAIRPPPPEIQQGHTMNSRSRFTRTDPRTRAVTTALAAVILASVHAGCLGQAQYVPPADPSQLPQQAQPSGLVAPQPPRRTSMRQLFAQTVAAVLGGLSSGLGAGVAQGVNGAIQNWFGPANPAPPTAQDAYAAQAAQQPYGAQDPYATQVPQNSYPAPVAQDPYAVQGTTDPYGAQPQYPQYPQQPGAVPTAAYGDPAPQDPYAQPPTAAPGYASYESGLNAGIAYEVHTLGAGGGSTPVDVSTHAFGTGERFVVYYRPTLPGIVTVHNVNPLGEERQIDSVSIAAGQLVTLGPYEFRYNKGQELLRLQLMPCRTDALMLATRDIVKVNDAGSGASLNLADCGGVSTRGAEVHTRDIVKVGVEDNTSFAFDPVQQQEIATGQFTPRELTIVFRHQ
jgi:hypothetical protein